MKEKKQEISLTERESYRLKEKIFLSVQEEKNKKKNRRIFYTAAASLVLLIGMGSLSQIQHEPSLEDFVKTASEIDIDEAEDVTLFLGNDTLIEKSSSIVYSSSGQNVHLGSGRKVNQQSLEKDKAVFNTVIVPYGKRTTLKLSDGSMVWLNSGSKLIYPAVFTGDSRPVYLEGEAIFDVAHNAKKPFKVHSKYQEIEVLGTVFNVSSYPNDHVIETVLKSGSVSITYPNSEDQKVKLNPGNLSSFEIEHLKLRVAKVDVNKYFSWRNGFLSLENSTLDEIMTKISRYYNITYFIQNENLKNQTLSGKLDINENLEEVLDVLRETTGFDFQQKEKVIIIK